MEWEPAVVCWGFIKESWEWELEWSLSPVYTMLAVEVLVAAASVVLILTVVAAALATVIVKQQSWSYG